MKFRFFFFFLLFGCGSLMAQDDLWSEIGKARGEGQAKASYEARFSYLLPWFMGKDYEEKTLDGQAEESLVIYTGGFDCVTFVENMQAACRSIGSTGEIKEDFANCIQESRYYRGEIGGYESRIHYFTDWMRQGVFAGRGTIITEEIGKPFSKTVNFMSSHPDKYPLLQDKEAIIGAENALNADLPAFLPKKELSSYASLAANGDIIALTTNIKGLDVVHTGLVASEDGKVYLVHASSKHGKVRKEPLKDYLNRYNYINGIIVFRPIMNE